MPRFTPLLAALGALSLSSAAMAVTNQVQANLGVISPFPYTHVISNSFVASPLGSGVFTDAQGHTISDATALVTSSGAVFNFYDDFLFTMPSSTNGSLTASALSISLGNVVGINNLQARLYSTTNGLTTGAAPGLISAWSTPTSVGGTTITMTSFNSPAQLVNGTTYALEIRGNVVGAGGNYAGSLLVQAVPVPEAEGYAMALAGLGVVGLLRARRRAA